MKRQLARQSALAGLGWLVLIPALARAEEPAPPQAHIDGNGPGWQEMTEADFVGVNGNPDTWTWKDGLLHCTGDPVGVIRLKKLYTNFELVVQWRHLRSGGNSGVFVWVPESSLKDLPKGRLPQGIEVQVLDHGYAEQYEKQHGKKPDWFTTNGDVFAVGVKMTPFPPLSPDGSRSFPRKQLSKGINEWNHYYVCDQRRSAFMGQWRRGVGRKQLRTAQRLLVPRIRGFADRLPQLADPRAAVSGRPVAARAISKPLTSRVAGLCGCYVSGGRGFRPRCQRPDFSRLIIAASTKNSRPQASWLRPIT